MQPEGRAFRRCGTRPSRKPWASQGSWGRACSGEGPGGTRSSQAEGQREQRLAIPGYVLPSVQHQGPRALEEHPAIPGLPRAQRVWREGADVDERDSPPPQSCSVSPPRSGTAPAGAGASRSPRHCSCGSRLSHPPPPQELRPLCGATHGASLKTQRQIRELGRCGVSLSGKGMKRNG